MPSVDEPLPRTSAAIRQGVADGIHIGAQLCVSRNRQTIADLAFGESRPGVPMGPGSMMLWLSCTKPLTAVAVAQLWEKGALSLDDQVARFLPEFATQGKEGVTLRHVLTHTGGFRWVETGWPKARWDETIARVCAARQERGWVVGRTAGYSPYASWFLLAEIVQRLDRRDFSRYCREAIFEPLGMRDSWLTISPAEHAALGERIGVMQMTEGGVIQDLGLDTPEACAACRPSGGGHGPARELGRFYEAMLAGGTLDGAQILRPQTVEALVARHRVGVKDATFGQVMDWGLGFMVNSRQYGGDAIPYQYGAAASPRAFGHGGNQSSISFADPERDLVVVCICNGAPGEQAHQARMNGILAGIELDLAETEG